MTTEKRGTGLSPFHGIQIPGICFESGHCIWLLDFAETPTEVSSYVEVWLIDPDGGTTLLIDPEEATPAVERYHEFDDVRGARIDVSLPDQETIRVAVREAGIDLEWSLTHRLTPRARALSRLLNVTPKRIARSRTGALVGTAALNLLLPANGLRVAGRTDTGRRYRTEPVRVTVGTDASATLDGEDLGGLTGPDRPVSFGDLHVTNRPIVTVGDLFLEYPLD